MESGEQKTKPVWIDVWKWSAIFACIGMVPGHIYTWYQLASGYNTEFWGLFLLLGSLGGALAAILGSIVGTICFHAWRTLWSWISFMVIILPMLIGQAAFGFFGVSIASPSTRGIIVAVGGYIGGCIGAWITPALAEFLYIRDPAKL